MLRGVGFPGIESVRTLSSTFAGSLIVESLERRTLLSASTLPGATQDLGGPVGPDVADPTRNVAYVVDAGSNRIVAVNTGSGTTVGLGIPAAGVAGLAVSPDGSKLFASEPSAQQVEVFSLPSLSLQQTLHVGGAVQQIVALANNRFAGMANGIQVFDGSTGASLYSLPSDFNGILHTSSGGTQLYSRARGLSGNDSSIHVWDVSGTGAPVSLPNIAGPTGANSTDFAVDPSNARAYFEDGGASGIEVTNLNDGTQTIWPFEGGGSGDGVAALEGGAAVYGTTFDGRIEQFSTSGSVLAEAVLPNGHNSESLVITPNGNLLYTYPTGIGIIGASSLHITELAHLAFVQQPTNAAQNAVLTPSVQVAIEDASGNVLTSEHSNVTITLDSGRGTLSGTQTVAAVNGIATFVDLSLDLTGDFTLAASDGPFVSAISQTFAIRSATLPSLAFLQQPASVQLGSTLPSITVESVDPNGQLLTNDNTIVTLSVASGPGDLRGTISVPLQNGIATFNDLSLSEAGIYRLRASDGTHTTGLSTSFNIGQFGIAPVLHLNIMPTSTTVIAGQPLPRAVIVQIEDPDNHVVTSDQSDVTIGIATGPTTALHGTLTVKAVNGIATFTNLSVNTTGVYTLAAMDGAATPNVTAKLVVRPASAAKLVFVQQPGEVAAGSAISPGVKVGVVDSFGNFLTADQSQVTLSLASAPPKAKLKGTLKGQLYLASTTFTNLVATTAGQYRLKVSAPHLATATSDTFTVDPGAAVGLVFAQQPKNGTAGHATNRAVVVSLLDKYKNVVTTGTSAVTFTAVTAQGVVVGDPIVINTVGGTATLPGELLTGSGRVHLVATDGGLSAKSKTFTLAPGAAAFSARAFAARARFSVTTLAASKDDSLDVLSGKVVAASV